MNREIRNKLIILFSLVLFLVISFFYFLPWIDSKSNLYYQTLSFNLQYLPIEVNKASLDIGYSKDFVSSVTFYFINQKEMDSININLPDSLVITGKMWLIFDVYGPEDYRNTEELDVSMNESEKNVLLKTNNKIKKGKMNKVTLDFQVDSQPNGKLELRTLGGSINQTKIRLLIDTRKYECTDFCFESNLEKSIKPFDRGANYTEFIANGKDSGVVYIKLRNKTWVNLWLLLFAINASLIAYIIQELIVIIFYKKSESIDSKFKNLENKLESIKRDNNKLDNLMKSLLTKSEFNKNMKQLINKLLTVKRQKRKPKSAKRKK